MASFEKYLDSDAANDKFGVRSLNLAYETGDPIKGEMNARLAVLPGTSIKEVLAIVQNDQIIDALNMAERGVVCRREPWGDVVAMAIIERGGAETNIVELISEGVEITQKPETPYLKGHQDAGRFLN